jgi:transposase InsO family protein
MGAAGSCFDNAMMEVFWGRMQVELLNRRRWKTRVELASAIHDYIECYFLRECVLCVFGLGERWWRVMLVGGLGVSAWS